MTVKLRISIFLIQNSWQIIYELLFLILISILAHPQLSALTILNSTSISLLIIKAPLF
uniref:Uncharacterized protein n=1 Tax=Borrelia hermsii TaxID=140 RepID=S4VU75_BORHE|nr:hypothetical protein BHA163 [Borrelia hermsii]